MNVKSSYEYCKSVTIKEAKNFYYGFLPLPPQKRRAMYALYAYMRHTDDITDEAQAIEEQKHELRQWRSITEQALHGNPSKASEMPAFVDTINRFSIPHHYISELIDGVEMDFDNRRYQQFQDLYQYCYKVASVVGLCCLHIYGFEKLEAKRWAVDCGIAFQLTNILRDIKEDLLRDRIYIPQEDFKRFAYDEKLLKSETLNESYTALINYQIAKAKSYYENGKKLVPLINRDSRFALRTLINIYESLLLKIEKEKHLILTERIKLTTLEKIGILIKSTFQKN